MKFDALFVEYSDNSERVRSRRKMTKAIAVVFESRWEEGVIETNAKLDLDSGVVFDIVESDAGSEYENLIGEFVVVGDREVAVEVEPDDNYRIDAPTLAAIKMEVQESLAERPRGLGREMLKIKVSLDGGMTFKNANEGVRIVYKGVHIPGDDGTGELHLNATHEGLITDVWTTRDESLDHNIGTSSQLIEDLVSDLVEEND